MKEFHAYWSEQQFDPFIFSYLIRFRVCLSSFFEYLHYLFKCKSMSECHIFIHSIRKVQLLKKVEKLTSFPCIGFRHIFPFQRKTCAVSIINSCISGKVQRYTHLYFKNTKTPIKISCFQLPHLRKLPITPSEVIVDNELHIKTLITHNTDTYYYNSYDLQMKIL